MLLFSDIKNDLYQLKNHLYTIDYSQEFVKNMNFWLNSATQYYHENIIPQIHQYKIKLFSFIY